ncbi:MAG: hypothetical protein ABH870_05360 [bacterium]
METNCNESVIGREASLYHGQFQIGTKEDHLCQGSPYNDNHSLLSDKSDWSDKSEGIKTTPRGCPLFVIPNRM